MDRVKHTPTLCSSCEGARHAYEELRKALIEQEKKIQELEKHINEKFPSSKD